MAKAFLLPVMAMAAVSGCSGIHWSVSPYVSYTNGDGTGPGYIVGGSVTFYDHLPAYPSVPNIPSRVEINNTSLNRQNQNSSNSSSSNTAISQSQSQSQVEEQSNDQHHGHPKKDHDEHCNHEDD